MKRSHKILTLLTITSLMLIGIQAKATGSVYYAIVWLALVVSIGGVAMVIMFWWLGKEQPEASSMESIKADGTCLGCRAKTEQIKIMRNEVTKQVNCEVEILRQLQAMHVNLLDGVLGEESDR